MISHQPVVATFNVRFWYLGRLALACAPQNVPRSASLALLMLCALATFCSLGCASSNNSKNSNTTTSHASTPYSLAVTPIYPVNTPGSTIQSTATASFSGVSSPPPLPITVTEDVTNRAAWGSSVPNVAMVSAAGLVTALATGETTIQASFDGVQGKTILIVADSSSFTPDANMNISRNFQSATLLNNGQVLIAGGGNNIPINGPLSSAELYDSIAKTFTATGNMTIPRLYATATLLSNGMVLIAGGIGGMNFSSTFATAELYNPAQGTFALTGSMSVARSNHTATVLNDGKVLIAGGDGSGGAAFSGLSSAEIYDPATGTFSVTGSMNDARQGQTATLLNNGTVLIAGGINSNPVPSAELYDPVTGTFTVTGSMTVARWGYTATLLNNGMVLVVGGESDNQGLATAELYDPSTGMFTLTGTAGPKLVGLFTPTATLLGSGEVLIAGGKSEPNPFATAVAYLYDPITGMFSIAGVLNTARNDQTATRLRDGTVLIAGGSNGSTNLTVASSERYLPSTSTPPGLLSIAVTPAAPTIAVNAAQAFVATGTFSDGSTQQLASVIWSSSNQSVASISSDISSEGAASGIAAGTTTITATAGSVNGSTTLTVR